MILFHPRVFGPMDVVMAELAKENTRCSSVKRFESMTYHVNEMDDFYQLVLEVPGIKKADITVQLIHGSVLQVTAERNFINKPQDMARKYKQSFVVDPKLVDTSRITADLEDGLLVLQVNKTSPKSPIDIPVTVSSPPSKDLTDSTDYGTLVTIDLPGVKSSNLKLQFDDDKINVDAERIRGSNVIKVKKTVIVNTRINVKLTCFNGYLLDGVLTITARKIDNDDSGVTSADDIVNIPISGHIMNKNQIEGDEAMKIGEHQEDDDVVVVETVIDTNENEE